MRAILPVLIAATLTVASPRADGGNLSWRIGVASICSRALLFDGEHAIGTEQGAIAVARDIRASTARRLARVRRLRSTPTDPRLARHWVRVERRLAGVYASSYLGIWRAIASANTPPTRAALPKTLGRLLHRPDGLRTIAHGLEVRLQVPDCTGGDNTTPSASMISGS
jgi:hypothetical protein